MKSFVIGMEHSMIAIRRCVVVDLNLRDLAKSTIMSVNRMHLKSLEMGEETIQKVARV